ncbi:MAG: HIT family protein [Actinomycetota bacterium]
MTDCVFCKIIEGELPGTRVYENEAVVVLMDINPWTRGHCLVIPRNHSANVFEISERDAVEVTKVAHLLAPAIKRGMGADGLNLLQSNGAAAWQSVEHFHMHLIPRWYSDSLIPPAAPMEVSLKTLETNAERIKGALL